MTRGRLALIVVLVGGAFAWGSATHEPASGAARSRYGAAPDARDRAARKRRDPVAARRDAIDTLFRDATFAHGLDPALDHVAGGTLAPEADPFWEHAVDAMAMTWIGNHAQLARGRDRMLLEARPRVRRLLAVSLAAAAEAELADQLDFDQRHAVAGDLIDVYFEADSAAFRHELLPGIAALSGGDVKLLLEVGAENVQRDRFGVLVRDQAAIERATRQLARGERVVPEDPPAD